ncbi:12192_t:CDS:1, partial [Acaulospora morrowiae]
DYSSDNENCLDDGEDNSDDEYCLDDSEDNSDNEYCLDELEKLDPKEPLIYKFDDENAFKILSEFDNEDKSLDKIEMSYGINFDNKNSEIKNKGKGVERNDIKQNEEKPSWILFYDLLNSARLMKESTQGCFDKQLFEQAIVMGEKLSTNYSRIAEISRGLRIIKEKYSEILVDHEKIK